MAGRSFLAQIRGPREQRIRSGPSDHLRNGGRRGSAGSVVVVRVHPAERELEHRHGGFDFSRNWPPRNSDSNRVRAERLSGAEAAFLRGEHLVVVLIE